MFNYVLNNYLDRHNCNRRIDIGQIDLKHWLNSYDLEEMWRRRNPDRKEYSSEGEGKCLGLIFLFISQSLDNQVDNIEYKHAPFSGHKRNV